MSHFQGNKLKVRCTDCVKFSGGKCAAKDVKVSSKKRRTCALYEFRGEYTNREVLDSVYLPYMDKKTRKLLQKFMKSNIVPVNADGTAMLPGDPNSYQQVRVPKSTATATHVLEEPVHAQESDGPLEENSSNIIWTP